MYTIINRTNNSIEYHTGNWPDAYLNELLDQGDQVIVMSSYSHTIKVPVKSDLFVDEWEWTDYKYQYT